MKRVVDKFLFIWWKHSKTIKSDEVQLSGMLCKSDQGVEKDGHRLLSIV